MAFNPLVVARAISSRFEFLAMLRETSSQERFEDEAGNALEYIQKSLLIMKSQINVEEVSPILKLVTERHLDATSLNELIDSIAAKVSMIDDADSLDAKDVNDAKRVIMKYWLFMRKSDWDTFGNKNIALRTKYIVAARLFRDLGSPHVREVSHANITHLILYLHHGFKLELDDDGYARPEPRRCRH